MAENNIIKEIMLNDIGHRNDSTGFHQNDLKQAESIQVVNTGVRMSTCNMIPSAYLQESYPSSNSFVWLSTYLEVRSIDPSLAESVLHMFGKIKRSLNG